MDNIQVVKETTLTVKDQLLDLVLPYLCSVFLQTRTKLKKLKNILNCCKMQIVLIKNPQEFFSKIRFPKILLLVTFVSFNVDSAISPIMINVLDT